MMKKITLLLTVTFLMFSGNFAKAQCTTFADSYNNLITAATGPVCFNGTTCGTVDGAFVGFGVFGSEGYFIGDIEAGAEYTFDMCSGTGAGAWIPEITILAPDGTTVDAWNGGPATGSLLTFTDNCTLNWTATQSGEYTIIINELGTFSGDAPAQTGCGATLQVDNGSPLVTCGPTSPALCLPPPNDLSLTSVFITDGHAQTITGFIPSHVVDFSKRNNVEVNIELTNIGSDVADSIIISSTISNGTGSIEIIITDTIINALASQASYTHTLAPIDFATTFPALATDDAVFLEVALEASNSNTELEDVDSSGLNFVISPLLSYTVPYEASFEMGSVTHEDFSWKYKDNDDDENTFGAFSFTNIETASGAYSVIGSIINGNSLSTASADETLQSPEFTLNAAAYEFSLYAATFAGSSATLDLVLVDAAGSVNTNLGTITLAGNDTLLQKYTFQRAITSAQMDYMVDINKTATGAVFFDLFEITELTMPSAPSVNNTWDACDTETTVSFNVENGNAYDIDWGDGNSETVTSSPATHVYSTAGSMYTVTVTASNILGSADGTTTVDAVALTAPDATFILNPSNITASVSAVQNLSCNTYTWVYADGSPNGSGPSDSHTYTANGEYNITLLVENAAGTTTTSQVMTVTTIGINEIDFVNGINVFPNPVNDVLNISFELNSTQNVAVELVSIDGRIVSTLSSNNTNSVNETINTSKLATGMYILNVTSDEGKFTRNIMVK